jgi:hypothetical protein
MRGLGVQSRARYERLNPPTLEEFIEEFGGTRLEVTADIYNREPVLAEVHIMVYTNIEPNPHSSYKLKKHFTFKANSPRSMNRIKNRIASIRGPVINYDNHYRNLIKLHSK